jgi:hypothetical protein
MGRLGGLGITLGGGALDCYLSGWSCDRGYWFLDLVSCEMVEGEASGLESLS